MNGSQEPAQSPQPPPHSTPAADPTADPGGYPVAGSGGYPVGGGPDGYPVGGGPGGYPVGGFGGAPGPAGGFDGAGGSVSGFGLAHPLGPEAAGGPWWAAPRRSVRRPVRRTAVVTVGSALAVLVLGGPLGLLWAWLAPGVPVIDTGRDGIVVNDPSPEEYIAADGWFTLLGLAFGILMAIAAWLLLRRDRGPFLLAGVVAGTLGAGWLVAPWVGGLVGRGDYTRWQQTSAAGATYLAPPEVHSLGPMLVPAFVAAIVLTLLAGWSNDPDLEMPGALPGQGPNSGGYGPGDAAFEPGGTGYGPGGVPYGPGGAAYGSGGAAYGSGGAAYGSGGAAYGPDGAAYGPGGAAYGPGGAAYGPGGTAYGPGGTAYGPGGTAYGPEGTNYGPGGTGDAAYGPAAPGPGYSDPNPPARA